MISRMAAAISASIIEKPAALRRSPGCFRVCILSLLSSMSRPLRCRRLRVPVVLAVLADLRTSIRAVAADSTRTSRKLP